MTAESAWEEPDSGQRDLVETLESRNSRRTRGASVHSADDVLNSSEGGNPLLRSETTTSVGAELVAKEASSLVARGIGGDASFRGSGEGKAGPNPPLPAAEVLKEETPGVLRAVAGPARSDEEQRVKVVETAKAQSAGVGIPAQPVRARPATWVGRFIRAASAEGDENPMRGGYVPCQARVVLRRGRETVGAGGASRPCSEVRRPAWMTR